MLSGFTIPARRHSKSVEEARRIFPLLLNGNDTRKSTSPSELSCASSRAPEPDSERASAHHQPQRRRLHHHQRRFQHASIILRLL